METNSNAEVCAAISLLRSKVYINVHFVEATLASCYSDRKRGNCTVKLLHHRYNGSFRALYVYFFPWECTINQDHFVVQVSRQSWRLFLLITLVLALLDETIIGKSSFVYDRDIHYSLSM